MASFVRRVARKVLRPFRKPQGQQTYISNTGDEENEVNTLNQLKMISDQDSLIKRNVLELDFNQSYLTIIGDIYFEDFPENDEEKIAKYLVLIDDDENELMVPLENHLAWDETIRKHTKFAGYAGKVDFSSIVDEKPLEPGKYRVRLELRQYLGNGWLIRRTTLGKIKNVTKNIDYTTKMSSFSARSNKTYSLLFQYNNAARSLTITSRMLSDVDPLENDITPDYEMDSKAMRSLKRQVFKFAYRFYKLLPIKQNRITFASDSRTNISGNFEFIYEEIKRRGEKFDCRFYLKPSIKAKKTWGETLSLAKAFATSRYILVDDFYPMIYPLTIRTGAELIQVWHAVGAFKTFGYSRVGMPGGPKLTSLNHKNYTKALVSSHNIADKYAEGFGIDEANILSTGIPRTDVFFDKDKQAKIKAKLAEELPFTKGKKVILFAPTFRGNGQQSAFYPFERLNFKKLYDAFHEDYVFLLKIHPFVQNKPAIPYEYTDFFYDVSDYREINDLLLITDELITDYSSVCFEYALLRRPIIFFAPDLADYMSKRSFYFDYFDFIPGKFADDTPSLIEKLKEQKVDLKRIDDFVNYFFDDIDGKATARFVDALEDGFVHVSGTDEYIDENGQLRTADGKLVPGWGKNKSEITKEMRQKLQQ